jgi:hypothetical protein
MRNTKMKTIAVAALLSRCSFTLLLAASFALRRLNDSPRLWFDANAFSPDGQRLLASRGGNLFVLDVATSYLIEHLPEGPR